MGHLDQEMPRAGVRAWLAAVGEPLDPRNLLSGFAGPEAVVMVVRTPVSVALSSWPPETQRRSVAPASSPNSSLASPAPHLLDVCPGLIVWAAPPPSSK